MARHRLNTVVIAFGMVSLLGTIPRSAVADDPNVIRYPRVYGPTGSQYGPGRAFEEYERRYGRPWHGYGGNTAVRQPGQASGYAWGVTGNPLGFPVYGQGYVAERMFGAYPYGYSAYGYQYYGSPLNYSYVPAAPLVIQPHPQFLGGNPFDNSVINNSLEEEVERWQQEIEIDPKQKFVERLVPPSTAEAQLRSLRAVAEGNEAFRQRNMSKAYERYRYAASLAEDLPDPRHRMGLTMVAMGKFSLSTYQFKRAIFLDDDWPANGPSLNEVFGEENELARVALVHRVAEWVREDIRDPERLFLLGVILHFDGDDRAREVFETAYRLAGQGPHLMAFLRYYADGNIADKGQPLPMPAEQEPSDLPPPVPPLPMPPEDQPEADQNKQDANRGFGRPALPELPPLPAP